MFLGFGQIRKQSPESGEGHWRFYPIELIEPEIWVAHPSFLSRERGPPVGCDCSSHCSSHCSPDASGGHFESLVNTGRYLTCSGVKMAATPEDKCDKVGGNRNGTHLKSMAYIVILGGDGWEG